VTGKQTLAQLLKSIDECADEVVELCSSLVKCPSENPPGDTTAVVALLTELFKNEGIDFEVFEPKQGVQSICAEWSGPREGPTLVLNGHIDVFPADDSDLWTYPPFSGRVHNGRIYGRGVADMKAGSTASLYTFLLFHRYRPPAKGTLRLMLVGDEESGGRWGTDWILDQHPEWKGDACLIGEPTGLGALRIGEKGQVWLRLQSTGHSYHAAVADGTGPIYEVARAILAIKDTLCGWPGEVPDEMRAVVDSSKAYKWFNRFTENSWVVDHISMNFGVVRGGMKINVAPRDAEVEVDIRLPLGVDPEDVVKDVERVIGERDIKASIERMLHRLCPARYTHPDHPFVKAAKDIISEVTGVEPILMFSPTFTDTRLFRARGVPAVLSGPAPHNMAGPDEHVTIEDLLATTKIHSSVAWRFLVEGGLVSC